MNVKDGKAGRKAEQSEATRAGLLGVARHLFAQSGYAAVSTEEIVKRAGVTRGALYHHFRDKQDLFRNVVEDLEREITEQIATRALSESDPWEQQRAAIGGFLDLCLDPAVQRIILTDAPSVLGLAEWREIEGRYGLALVRAGLENLVDAGLIEEQPVEPLAHLLLGALAEAGLVIARAEDTATMREEVGRSVDRMFAGLRVSGDTRA